MADVGILRITLRDAQEGSVVNFLGVILRQHLGLLDQTTIGPSTCAE